MAEKKEKKIVMYEAELEMTRISKATVRYRVVAADDVMDADIHHLEFAREHFPKDDDFNMDFMGRDLTDESKAMKAKQKNFRAYMNPVMQIVM